MVDDKQLRLRILFGQEIAMGPGKLNLLRAISTRGSISGAARQMNMSYRRAWLLVDTMNRCFRSPVVAASPGGKGGGGATITEFGQTVVDSYEAMEQKAVAATLPDIKKFSLLMSDNHLPSTYSPRLDKERYIQSYTADLNDPFECRAKGSPFWECISRT